MKRLSEQLMRETQLVYTTLEIAFDPYWFPVFWVVLQQQQTTTTALTQATRTTQPAVTQITSKLSAAGYITFTVDAHDKRKKQIVLSPKGLQLAEDLKPVWAAIKSCTQQFTQSPADNLLAHFNRIEHLLEQRPFHEIVLSSVAANSPAKNLIVEFEPEYAERFKALNIEWLEAYFKVEAYDRDVLSHPEKYILNQGGRIFFIKHHNEIVGTVALMKVSEQVFELTKMAVDPRVRGQRLGQRLIRHVLDTARAMQLKKLVLYSNTILENAIYLYRKYGFVEVPIETESPYRRSDIKMEYIVR